MSMLSFLFMVAIGSLIELIICNFTTSPWYRAGFPVFIFSISVAVFFTAAFVPLEGMKDLEYVALSIFLFETGIATLIVAIICSFFTKENE